MTNKKAKRVGRVTPCAPTKEIKIEGCLDLSVLPKDQGCLFLQILKELFIRQQNFEMANAVIETRVDFTQARVVLRVLAERQRQRQLFVDRKITFDVASPVPDTNRKLRVLIEEVGEVAQELDHLEQLPGSKPAQKRLREELTQVAAVAVAWLESLEPSPTSRPSRDTHND